MRIFQLPGSDLLAQIRHNLPKNEDETITEKTIASLSAYLPCADIIKSLHKPIRQPDKPYTKNGIRILR